ncbi:MAG: hypothetical protein ACXU8S_02955 [Phenylobacterium sp.]
MRGHLLAIGLLALAAATPAVADTGQEVAAHGMTLKFQGADAVFAFTPDGKVSGMNGRITGTWRIEGDKVCSETNTAPENCLPLPAGKKSGDSFDVELPAGTATVKIN